jgi:purine-binding chemotaxis protein CheW
MQKESHKKREEKQILVFRSAGLELGLDISCVREVLRPQPICPVPKTPPFIEGVINLRGRIVALVDLAKRLNSTQAEEEPNPRIIVCKVNGFLVGLIVSRLREIIALSQEEIAPTPDLVSMKLESKVISGMARVGDRIIPLLDLEYLLNQKEVTELSALKA